MTATAVAPTQPATFPAVVHVVEAARQVRAVVTALAPREASVELFAGDRLIERRHHPDQARAVDAATRLAPYYAQLAAPR